MQHIVLTVPEILSLIGVAQCVYILVYVTFRARHNFLHVVLPLLYFLVLGAAFFTDMARGYIAEISPYYNVISWALWTLGTPLSVLLIIQMSQIHSFPRFLNWCVLLVVPAAFLTARLVSDSIGSCMGSVECPDFIEWINITGMIAGALSLLMVWGKKTVFSDVLTQKAGKERYWLILALIIVNVAFLALMAFQAGGVNLSGQISFLRTVLGLAFVYIVSTSLFRIYPNALFTAPPKRADDLSSDDLSLAKKIESLLAFEKIYHEATYSRSDLAQELGVPEATVSKIINIYFKKSFPKLLNEYRVADSKILLLDTDANINIVAQEVGFNSMPSFNRVFKELEGQSPSAYRRNMIK